MRMVSASARARTTSPAAAEMVPMSYWACASTGPIISYAWMAMGAKKRALSSFPCSLYSMTRLKRRLARSSGDMAEMSGAATTPPPARPFAGATGMAPAVGSTIAVSAEERRPVATPATNATSVRSAASPQAGHATSWEAVPQPAQWRPVVLSTRR